MQSSGGTSTIILEPCFSLGVASAWVMSEASFLKMVMVSGDIPPVVEKIGGVKVPCTILQIR